MDVYSDLGIQVSGGCGFTESVKVVPREQLGSFKEVPGVEAMKISGKWLHPDSFKDECLSERLRLQLWTLRIE